MTTTPAAMSHPRRVGWRFLPEIVAAGLVDELIAWCLRNVQGLEVFRKAEVGPKSWLGLD